MQITRKNLKLTTPENSWLFLDSSCTDSKILSDPPFEAHLEKVLKNHEKKVAESKNVFYKRCRKFYILGGDFLFWRNPKNEGSRAKKRLFEREQKSTR